MKCIKVEIKKTQPVKEYIIKKRLVDNNYGFKKDKKYFYFPVSDTKLIKKRFPFVNTSNIILKKKKHKITTTHSYDVVGDIIIIEKGDKKTANELLNQHKHISTVLRKEQGRKGVFRLLKYSFLGGEKAYETTHKENNVRIKVNLKKMYFSPRLNTERKRITKQVKKGEEVLVMFSGCGPYPLVISKNTDAKTVYGVEINKQAHEYAQKNMMLNKLNNIKLYCGDVRKVVPKLRKKFDRIIMPLPRTGEEFLDVAVNACKKNGTIHLYGFLDVQDIPKKIYGSIRTICKKMNKKHRLLRCVKVGQYSPRKFRVCAEFRILN